MPNGFERCRLELLPDGSANIGIVIFDADVNGDRTGAYPDHAEWMKCAAPPPHAHGWATCDVRTLANTRQLDQNSQPIVGTSPKELAVAWLNNQRASVQPVVINPPANQKSISV